MIVVIVRMIVIVCMRRDHALVIMRARAHAWAVVLMRFMMMHGSRLGARLVLLV